MRLFYALLMTITLLCGAVSTALGHGVPMYVQANDLGALSSTGLVFYDAAQSKLSPSPAGSPTILKGNAAFHPVFGDGIPAGTILNADASGSAIHPAALLYWDGTSVLESPVTINLTRTGVNVDVTPSSTFVTGGALGAYDGTEAGHSSFTVALPLSAPVGLYAIGFQVTGGAGFEQFTRSSTFWGVMNYGIPEANVPAGLAALTSAVPEPSSIALCAIGGVICAVSAVRRSFLRS